MSQDFCVEILCEVQYRLQLIYLKLLYIIWYLSFNDYLAEHIFFFSFAVKFLRFTISSYFSYFFSYIIVCVYTAWTLYNERKRPNTIAFDRGLTQLGMAWFSIPYSEYLSIHTNHIWHNMMTITLHSPFIYSQRSTECVYVCNVCMYACMRAPFHVFSVAFSLPSEGFTIFGFYGWTDGVYSYS